MKFQLRDDSPSQLRYLTEFLALVGGASWRRRLAQLIGEVKRSFALAKIVEDYHWLELTIDELIASDAPDVASAQTVEEVAALHFTGMVVECHRRLGPAGRATLEGRLRSALQAETGFAALYAEMSLAHRLLGNDFDVDFPDLEGSGQYDLEFVNAGIAGEVECKSLSADAGRKIHRKDFYRYMNAVTADLLQRADAGSDDVVLIVLDDRLPSAMGPQRELRDATARLIREVNEIRGSFFTMRRESYVANLGSSEYRTRTELYSAYCDAFGENCHVSGVKTERGVCLVVMRSCKEDDTSKPWLEATKEAAGQFSGERPAFIAMQFNDIAAADLLATHLRRRAEILTADLFFDKADTAHVVAVFFCPYRGLVGAVGGVGAPAISVLNPRTKFRIDPSAYAPLMDYISDAAFSHLVRQQT